MKYAEDNPKSASHEVKKEHKTFEKRMLLILCITTMLAICAILLIPIPAAASVTDKIRGILVILLIVAITGIANALNIAALAAKKSKHFRKK